MSFNASVDVQPGRPFAIGGGLNSGVIGVAGGLTDGSAVEMAAGRVSADGGSAQEEPKPNWICPITQEVMRWPAIAADGFAYEEAELRRWLERSNTSPMTGVELKHKTLRPAKEMRAAIGAWRARHQHCD
mmetsp:Transcript_23091/g.53419  ORF Transcript_23091/g.53419 Transcript_23091/m.53419 type:complete len:130 (+) Transcript_23091:204-593(+)